MHFDDRDECVREMEEEEDRRVTRTEAGLTGKSEEETRKRADDVK